MPLFIYAYFIYAHFSRTQSVKEAFFYSNGPTAVTGD